MATWSGWGVALEKTLDVTSTAANRKFLNEWAKATTIECGSNPLAAVLAFGDSKHCHHVSGDIYVQAYSSHAHGIEATAKQLREKPYAPILAALKSGDPVTYTGWQETVGALGTWGAHAFAVEYSKEATTAQPGSSGGGAATVDAARSLAGYKHFANQLVYTIPEQIRRSQHLRAEALAKLRGRA